MHKVSCAAIVKDAIVETQQSQKANTEYNRDKLSQKQLEVLEKQGSRILSWATKNRKCEPIVGIVVADMMAIAPNAIEEIESQINHK